MPQARVSGPHGGIGDGVLSQSFVQGRSEGLLLIRRKKLLMRSWRSDIGHAAWYCHSASREAEFLCGTRSHVSNGRNQDV